MRNRSYETMMLLRPELDEAGCEAVIKFVKELAKREGFEITSVDDLGKKTLTYEINKIGEAFYYLLTFDATPAFVAELDRNLKLNDKVLRFLTVLRLQHYTATLRVDEKPRIDRIEAEQTDEIGQTEELEGIAATEIPEPNQEEDKREE